MYGGTVPCMEIFDYIKMIDSMFQSSSEKTNNVFTLFLNTTLLLHKSSSQEAASFKFSKYALETKQSANSLRVFAFAFDRFSCEIF